MDTIQVNDWAELHDVLFADSWNESIGRYRSHYAFRGLEDSAYPLSTTLMRLGGEYAALERHLLRNFKKYAHRDVVQKDSLWHWLSVAKHYGLPARLLDWSYSPYVALHFATADIKQFHRDAAIWAVNFVKVHELTPPVLKEQLESEGANVFTVEMLSETVKTLEGLNAMKPPFVLFFEPPSIDDRIVNQYAFFSVCSDPTLHVDDWLAQNPGVWRKIIIPSKLKWEIRDKLDQANISERVMFPGLDGLTCLLRRQYSPRN
ncbi:MAG: FRG domain-containing protein [Verrucomicrobia bacterium GWC2_42_7]|nr:MAG: FRG domain-containing protein [Verrucomicrobia bacterium GWC2_42_7]